MTHSNISYLFLEKHIFKTFSSVVFLFTIEIALFTSFNIIVTGWLSGREAEFIETLTEEEVGEKCVETIKQVLKTTDIPKLKRVVMYVIFWK